MGGSMEELQNLYPSENKDLSEDNYGLINGFIMDPPERNVKWGDPNNGREAEKKNEEAGKEERNFAHVKEVDRDDCYYGSDELYDNGNDKNKLPFDKKKHEKLIRKICYRNDLKYYNYYINNFEKIKNIKGIKDRGENRICVLILCLNYIYCNLNNEIMTIHELKRQIKKNITKTRVYCKNLAKILFIMCGKLQIKNFTKNDILPYMEKCITTIIKRLKFLDDKVGRDEDFLHVSRKANIFDEIFDFINNGSSEDFLLNEEKALFAEVTTSDGEQVEEFSQSDNLSSGEKCRNIHGEETAHKIGHAEEVIPHAWVNDTDNTRNEDCNMSLMEGGKKKYKTKKRKNEKNDCNERKRKNTTTSKEVTKDIDKNVMIQFLEKNVTLLSLYSCLVYSIFIISNRTENMDSNLYNKESRKYGGNLHYFLCSSIIITFDMFNIKVKDQFVCFCLGVVQQTIATEKKKILKFFLTTFSEFLGLDIPSIQTVALFMRILFSNYMLLQMYLFYVIKNYELIKKEGFLPAMEQLQIFLAKLFGTIHEKFLNVADISVNYDLFLRSDWVCKNVVQMVSQNEDLPTVKKFLKDLNKRYSTDQGRETRYEYNFEESYQIDLNHIDLYIPRILAHCLGIFKGEIPPSVKLLPSAPVGGEKTILKHLQRKEEELGSAMEDVSPFHYASACVEDTFDYQRDVQDEQTIRPSSSFDGSNNEHNGEANTYSEDACNSAACDTTCDGPRGSNSPKNIPCTSAHRKGPDDEMKKQLQILLEETKVGRKHKADFEKGDTSKIQIETASLDLLSSHIKTLKKINLQNIHEMNMEIIPFFHVKIVVQFLFYNVLKSIIYNCYSLSFFSVHNLHRSVSTRKSEKENSRVCEEFSKGEPHGMSIFLKNKIASKIKEMKRKKYTFEKYIICEQSQYIKMFQNCKMFGEDVRRFLNYHNVKLHCVKDLFSKCAFEEGANDSHFLDTSTDRPFNGYAVQAEGEHPPLCRNDNLSGSSPSRCGASRLGTASSNQRGIKGSKNNLKRSKSHERSNVQKGKKIKIALCHYDVGVENCNDCHKSLEEEPFNLFDYIYNSKMIKEYKNVEELFSRKNFALLFNMFNNMNNPFHGNKKKLIKINDCLYHTYHLIGIKKIVGNGYSFTYKNELNDNYYKVLKTKICNILSVQDIYFLFNRFFYFLLVYIKSHCCFGGETGSNLRTPCEVDPPTSQSPQPPQPSQASKVCPCNKVNCCYKIKTIVLLGNV
ncbi:conserved Plasmodium protein, unknown function [Plasmodium knowlesi strain H]|uniref:Uncharacterized protein n=3 Tax=Plasmodium knowlesi TaxID=5850 RepID=A0A5K1VDV2_PLAKH|nr:conserved Plasmodium protein, unknown function [Plasmodium knowlesi strain H]OTN65833.1 Uncharacterized protein PKNOH_S100042600 [Plasmodium knowlesi]CAA9987789.1 conserved Plasmodium protein, unknown function [Plasmodium knowlesi strain H]SBO22440.1 conserved Plasmodium protein, unknown function [Plasmodium knowlesi strain H]SBO29540.1 conserved Plasmodium protein, unknown function [Plasmodium knowlesi strain H]VVS77263.1 conserved Plasmodium protein, unknown function [Plasmodium knowlesi |eukprot:XP_002258786.1 hypothetical protein, conserved in Plasmodium species [Plasmodium knowlesi strain H]